MPAILKASGLNTYYNSLSEIPDGALLEAINVVIDRNGIIEQRRGFREYSSFPGVGDRAKQLITYKNRILRHYYNNTSLSNKLEFDNGSGSFTAFDGDYNETENGLRIKSVEANGNLYFTTDTGIKKISAFSASEFSSTSGYIRDAGGPKALDVQAIINYETPGFFEAESKVAYRIVWNFDDANGNQIQGSPSSRTVVTNTDLNLTATVDLSFSIPSDVDSTAFYYQIYRTAVLPKGAAPSLDDIDPGDECYLVYEASVTAAELVAGVVEVNDIAPEDFRANGALLYTNPVSGQGIEQANEKPPLAKDVALFKGSVFYANTKTVHRKQISLLSISGFVSGTSKFVISNGAVTNEYTFVGAKEVTDITTVFPVVDASYVLINSASNLRKYFIWIDATGTTIEPSTSETLGRIPIRVDTSAALNSTDVAVALRNAVNNISDFSATNLANVVTITNSNNGKSDDAADGSGANATTFGISTTTQGDGEDTSLNQVLLSALPTPSQQIDDSARSLVRVINANALEVVYAYYLSGPDDVPGTILLESRELTDIAFFVGVNSSSLSGKFNPSLPYTSAITDISAANPSQIESVGHGLATGDEVVIYGTDSTPSADGVFVVTVVDIDNFTIPYEVSVAGTTGSWFRADEGSDNEISPNRVYFSKYQQPDAVPILNYLDIGPKDQPIRRIIALRDSLFVLKDDGVYRITGAVAPNFSVILFDGSTKILAADTAAPLNNQIYFLSDQGVCSASDTGVEIISQQINNLVQPFNTSDFLYYTTASFGIGYDVDKAYIIWLPENETDQVGTFALRYQTVTKTWTMWDKVNTCAVLQKDKLYLGSGNRNVIEEERKSFTRLDYADREVSLSIPAIGVDGAVVTLSSTAECEIGDVLSQVQYLTIVEYNRLLKKLDMDYGVADSNYYDVLGAISGDDLRDKVNDLASKLDSDSGVADTNYLASLGGGSSFANVQADFNIIVNKLNLDSGVFFSNYHTSTGTKTLQMTILDVTKNGTTITLLYEMPFIEGDVILYKGIQTSVVWAPLHGGDPSLMKQAREMTVLFEKNTFTFAEVAFSSDLSPNFEAIDFQFPGPGVWGFFPWGRQNWGGNGNSTPFRTLVPQQKQRHRFLNLRFKHGNAFEKYVIQGISINARGISDRAYR